MGGTGCAGRVCSVVAAAPRRGSAGSCWRDSMQGREFCVPLAVPSLKREEGSLRQ